jgi:hypothetical protein
VWVVAGVRVLKTTVSLPSAASHSIPGVDGGGISDADNRLPEVLSRGTRTSLILAGLYEIRFDLKHSLYFLSGLSEEVTKGSS